METIFDHNITAEEVKSVTDFNLSKEKYLKHNYSQIDCYVDIYYLYLMRGEKAQGYFDKILDSLHKYFSIGMFDF